MSEKCTLPAQELSIEQLAEIGRLAIAAHIAGLDADEHRERASAEGWDSDPTGSSWLGESRQSANAAHNAFLAKLSEHGLLREFEND